MSNPAEAKAVERRGVGVGTMAREDVGAEVAAATEGVTIPATKAEAKAVAATARANQAKVTRSKARTRARATTVTPTHSPHQCTAEPGLRFDDSRLALTAGALGDGKAGTFGDVVTAHSDKRRELGRQMLKDPVGAQDTPQDTPLWHCLTDPRMLA